jgi:hypothetical protein
VISTGPAAGFNILLGGVVISKGGVLYGVAQSEVTPPSGTANAGLVFSVTPAAGGQWTTTVLDYFAGYPTEGAFPAASLVIGEGGVLYGTTQEGGNGPCQTNGGGCGTAFSLKP